MQLSFGNPSKCRMLTQFFSQYNGTITIMTAIMLPMILGVSALSIDYGLWLYQQRKLEMIADAASAGAALAIQAGYTSSVTSYAITDCLFNGFVVSSKNTIVINNPPTSGANVGNTSAVQVILTQASEGYLSPIMSISPPLLQGPSVGGAATQNACAVSLGNSAGITVIGNGSISAANCGLYSNFTSSNSIVNFGNGGITAATITSAGGLSGSGIQATGSNNSNGGNGGNGWGFGWGGGWGDGGGGGGWGGGGNGGGGNGGGGGGGCTTNAPVVPDPYTNVSMPAAGSCTATNHTCGSKEILSPGTYCGGLNVPANSQVTLSPGTYVVNGGCFNVDGSASVSGNGVTVVLTGASGSCASANIGQGATLNLSAPTSGSLDSILFFGDRSATGVTHNFGGGPSDNCTGVIYTPASNVVYGGNNCNGGSGSPANTQIVADNITVTAPCSLNNGCSGSKTTQVGCRGLLE